MADVETVELILSAVAGPASGIVVALISMGAFGWFLVKHLLPGHERTVDKIIKSHDEDRKLFEKSINSMGRRLDKIEDDVAFVRSKV